MSVPLWPSDLPQRLLREGYSEAFRDGRLRTKPETGPPKTRRRFSTAVKPVQGAVDVTLDGKARLERFWDEDTAGGTLPFWMPDQSYDGVPLTDDDGLPLLDGDGRPFLGSALWLCLFGETPPTWQSLGGMWWRGAIQFTVMP